MIVNNDIPSYDFKILNIHSFYVSVFLLHMVFRNLKPITGDSRYKAGDSLDMVPTHCRACSHTHTHNWQFRDASQFTINAFWTEERDRITQKEPTEHGENKHRVEEGFDLPAPGMADKRAKS